MEVERSLTWGYCKNVRVLCLQKGCMGPFTTTKFSCLLIFPPLITVHLLYMFETSQNNYFIVIVNLNRAELNRNTKQK